MLQKFEVDLLFLDIQMPQILGTDFIRALKNAPRVIFTTAYREFAIEGFELDAVDYLLKPISFERFLKGVNKVMNLAPSTVSAMPASESKSTNINESFYFRSDRRMIKVASQDILYIESIKDYIKIFTTNGTIVTKQAISSVEENLPKDKFVRIHRSFIISLSKIDSYSHELVWVAKTELPIGRMYKHEVDKVLRQR
jgi:DNA-binding LytR/AlgR family response regulator